MRLCEAVSQPVEAGDFLQAVGAVAQSGDQRRSGGRARLGYVQGGGGGAEFGSAVAKHLSCGLKSIGRDVLSINYGLQGVLCLGEAVSQPVKAGDLLQAVGAIAQSGYQRGSGGGAGAACHEGIGGGAEIRSSSAELHSRSPASLSRDKLALNYRFQGVLRLGEPVSQPIRPAISSRPLALSRRPAIIVSLSDVFGSYAASSMAIARNRRAVSQSSLVVACIVSGEMSWPSTMGFRAFYVMARALPIQ